MAIATVIAITGQAWARDAQGNLRELRVGDTLAEGEVLVTADNARVELDFGDGLDPTLIQGGQEVAMTPELSADEAVTQEEASALDEDLEALLTAIDEGEGDLLEELDATAAGAGPGGAAGGGHSFVMLGHITEQVSSLSFDYGLGQLESGDFPENELTALAVEEEAALAVEEEAALAVEEEAALAVEEEEAANSLPSVATADLDGDMVWESALQGGSGGGTDTTTGSFQIDTGDDGLALIEVQDKDGNWTAITADGTAVAGEFGTLIVNPDGSWSYTLDANTLEHDGNDATGIADQVQDLFGVRVTDDDGDVSPEATLTLDINDDGPSAEDEAPQALDEGGSVTGQFDVSAGADGGGITHIDGTELVFGDDGWSQTLDLDYGMLRVMADGSYEYTADASVTNDGDTVDTITYTVTDGDGDQVTANASFRVDDASVPSTGDNDDAIVDDDGLEGGNPGGDGDLAGQGGDETTFSGTLGFDYGDDGAGQVDFAAMHGQTASLGTETITYSWDDDINVLTATVTGGQRDGQALFQVEITDAVTGDYTVTLLTNVRHADDEADTENEVALGLTYTVTDGDGSMADGTLNVTFDDDTPVASDYGHEAVIDEGSGTTVLASDAADALGISAGADGLAGTLSNITFTNLGTTGGSLSIDGDGQLVYTAPASVDNSDGPVAETFEYTVVDQDGDSVTRQVIVQVGDAHVPTIDTPEGDEVVATVDDDGLAGGNPGGEGDLAGQGGDETTFSGTLGFDYGDDGAGHVDFAAMHGQTGALGTETITYGWDGDSKVLTATVTGGQRDGQALFQVEITDAVAGDYTVTLLTNVRHADDEADTENEAALGLTYTVTDGDGSTADGTLNVTFDDDTPVLDIRQVTFENSGNFLFVGSAVKMGADQGGAELVWTEAPKGLSFEDTALVYEGIGTGTLTAFAGEGGVKVFEVIGSPDGTYTFQQFEPIDLKSIVSTDFTAGDFNEAGGPEPNVFILEDGSISRQEPAADNPWAVKISGIGGVGGNANQINSNTNGFGVGTPTFSNGESVTFDFDLNGDSGDPDFFAAASIEFSATSGIDMDFTVTYSDGTEESGNFKQADLVDQAFTFQAPDGLFLDSVTLDNVGAGTQITGFGVDELVETIEEGIPFDIAFTAIDGDGDEEGGVIDFFAEPGEELDLAAATSDSILVGSAGDNELIGGGGDDIFYGGAGDDIMSGGLGADTFAWNFGDEGAENDPAKDTVMDFTLGEFGTDADADKLDIGDLLQGADFGSEDIDDYILAKESGSDTMLHIKHDGGIDNGDGSNADQTILLKDVGMDGNDSSTFIQSLIDSGQLDIE